MVHDFSYTVVVSYIFQDWFVNVARQVDFLSVSKHIAFLSFQSDSAMAHIQTGFETEPFY